ncbi:MAG: hypothetical protein AB7P00_25710, partial [Sandaracinaceae bacterium]
VCEPDPEPVFLGESLGGNHQIGVVGDKMFVAQGAADFTWWGQWVERDTGAPFGEVVYLGLSPSARPAWVPDGSSLLGALTTDLEATEQADADASRIYGIWRVTPTAAERTPLPRETPADCYACRGGGGYYEGGNSAFRLGERTLAVTNFALPRCVGPRSDMGLYPAPLTLHVVDLATAQARPVEWASECDLDGTVQSDASLPWGVTLSDGNIGIFFDVGVRMLPRRYVVVTPEAEVVHGPVVVGATDREYLTRTIILSGEATRVGRHVLFVEGDTHEVPCHSIRVIDEDGSNAHDAPWQLPCGFTSFVRLQAMGEYAAFTYSETFVTNPEDPTPSDHRFTATVTFVLLDEDGQLASEPVVVTPPDATPTSEPSVNPFVSVPSSLWIDGEGSALVSYASQGARPAGLYVRRVGCRAIDP